MSVKDGAKPIGVDQNGSKPGKIEIFCGPILRRYTGFEPIINRIWLLSFAFISLRTTIKMAVNDRDYMRLDTNAAFGSICNISINIYC